jgi:flagellar operon protein
MTNAIHLNGLGPAGQPAKARPQPAASTGNNFAACLDAARQVSFSTHAQKRMDTRNIQMNPDRQVQLADAVDRAAARGGKESLVLMDDLAFIVNVADRLVITALDEASRKEGVFTKIDSVVLAYQK